MSGKSTVLGPGVNVVLALAGARSGHAVRVAAGPCATMRVEDLVAGRSLPFYRRPAYSDSGVGPVRYAIFLLEEILHGTTLRSTDGDEAIVRAWERAR